MKTSPEKLAYIKDWQKRNKDKVRAYARTQYARNREAKLATWRKSYYRHHARNLERKRQRNKSAAHLAWARAYNAQWRSKHPDVIREAKRKSDLRNREACRARESRRNKVQWANLTDYVMRKHLKQLTKRTPTPQEIESCRQRIKIKRAQKQLKFSVAAQSLLSLSEH